MGVDFSFRYEFQVEQRRASQSAEAIRARMPACGLSPRASCWTGQGSGEGFAGPNPRFELCSGWLTLLPPGDWKKSFHQWFFADWQRPPAGQFDPAELQGDLEAAREISSGRHDPRAFAAALEEVDRRKGRRRDVASYSVSVGPALEKALRAGDQLTFWHGNEFMYSLKRDGEIVLRAGPLDRNDEGGAFAVWQSRDEFPQLDQELRTQPSTREQVMEQIRKLQQFVEANPVYASARIQDKTFRLTSRQGSREGRYYVFLGRANESVQCLGDTSEAIYSAGRLDVIHVKEIEEAALHLMSPKTMLL